MGTLWLEAILISHIVHGVNLAIGSREGEGATYSDCFILSTGIGESTLLFMLLAIGRLPSVNAYIDNEDDCIELIGECLILTRTCNHRHGHRQTDEGSVHSDYRPMEQLG